MTQKDKIAILLAKYGFSLAEGMQMYEDLKASKEKLLVKIYTEKNCVVWIEDEWDGDPDTISLTVWRDYADSFCLNYELVGAIALRDENIEANEAHTKDFIDFFRAYRNDTNTELPEHLYWIFTSAALDDYVPNDWYKVDAALQLNIIPSL